MARDACMSNFNTSKRAFDDKIFSKFLDYEPLLKLLSTTQKAPQKYQNLEMKKVKMFLPHIGGPASHLTLKRKSWVIRDSLQVLPAVWFLN